MRQKLLALYSFALVAVACMVAPVVALATDTPGVVTIPTYIDVSVLGTSFGTSVTLALVAGVTIMFGVAIVVIGVKWILRGGKRG
jgi:hypothetical protein